MGDMPEEPIGPLTVAAVGDPGDTVQQAFRYQHTLTAIAAVGILLEPPELMEVYCEQHEDVLVVTTDGRLICRQVKSRETHLGGFTSGDAEVKKALAKFIRTDCAHPGKISGFRLASSVGYKPKADATGLQFIIDTVQASDTVDACTPKVKKYIQDLAILSGQANDSAFHCLKRVELDKGLPSRNDVELRLIGNLARCPSLQGRTHLEIARVARALVEQVYRAASLANHSAVADYLGFRENPHAAQVAATIEGKRLTKEKILATVTANLPSDGLLAGWEPALIATLPKGMKRLEKKMAAGGVSVANIDLAKDHKFSAEHLFLEWLDKLDPAEANRRYDHVKTVVKTECLEAHDEAQSVDNAFGNDLLRRLRERIPARLEKEGNSLFGCKKEHLHGVAGILTEECKLWWSPQFNIEGEQEKGN